MSQAGITKADKEDYLELHGWERLPRKHGAATQWRKWVGHWLTGRTEQAYEIERES